MACLSHDPNFKRLVDGIERGLSSQGVSGVGGSLKPFFWAGLQAAVKRPLMIITASSDSANLLLDDLRSLLTPELVLYYPEEDLVSFEVAARSPELAAERLVALQRLAQNDWAVIVVPVRALLRRIIPQATWQEWQRTLAVGDTLNLREFLEFMVEAGYERTDLVEAPGQFSSRGGIIDCYPLTEPHPIRLELFDNEIESIRQFDAVSQRSLAELPKIVIGPVREVVGSPQSWKQGINRLNQAVEPVIQRMLEAGQEKLAEKLRARREVWQERMEFRRVGHGLEPVLCYLYEQTVTLLDYLAENAMVILDEPQRIEQEVKAGQQEFTELWAELLEEGLALPGQEGNLVPWAHLSSQLASRQSVVTAQLPSFGPLPWRLNNQVNVTGRNLPRVMGQLESFIDEVRQWQKELYAIVVLTPDNEARERLRQIFLDFGVLSTSNPKEALTPGTVAILEGKWSNGFQLNQAKLVLITETDLLGPGRRPAPLSRRKATAGANLELFADLKAGDYVVHASHGIGRYKGVEKLTVAGVQKDYLLVQYAGEDRLYVPTDQVQLLQKYIGAEGQAPRVNKLGGSEWVRTKARVKQSVKDIADELIKLYAARETLPGFAFSPDNVWQQEFEAAFPYVETADQIQSIAEIKQDMLTPRPMDRLLCGDVGYGKTEVALRAAFKAVMDSKQVAVLVPTTVLAQQHYQTFKERLSGYPVTVEVLSRFKTAKEQKEILAKTALGQVDILIGTHRLLSNDITFRDLGLLVIDEEQRFGVAHKERLKQMRQNVDVLTLTATPIPRTLHMAMAKVKDMSVIETPPEDRFPVQTYVVEYSPELVREAIRRELRRGGQVYYVHNRVYDLRSVARQLQDLVPEAKIGIAHGQMKELHLEKVMYDFIEGKYDLLVSTTIVESGLDIPNVNTLIVQDADHMGLAQLYQLRGRVGRSNRLAYAYFTYRKDKMITEVAAKRLNAIREFTEFGSGFKIALRDLEIRGAGNLLGAEQHGHMASVGFDMYCRLLEESVQELQGQTALERPSLPVVELPVDAFIPDEYLTDPRLKMEIYRKLADAENLEILAEVETEIRDRFGPIPKELENLIGLTRLRLLAHLAQVSSLQQQGENLRLRFAQPKVWPADTLARLMRRLGKQAKAVTLLEQGDLLIKNRGLEPEDLAAILETLLWEAISSQVKK